MGCGQSKPTVSAEVIDADAPMRAREDQPSTDLTEQAAPLPVTLGSLTNGVNKQTPPVEAELVPKERNDRPAEVSTLSADTQNTSANQTAEASTPLVNDAIQKAGNEQSTTAAENVCDVVCEKILDVGDLVLQEGEGEGDEDDGRSFRLDLPGRVAWVPERKPGAGLFCGPSLVNVAPGDRSILCRPHDGMVTLTAVLLFVNPNGGKKKGAELGQRAVAAFEANSVKVTVIETTHARHAEEYLRDTKASEFEAFQAVIGIGGDGTFSEIINGLMARTDGLRIPLGLLAGGTGNSFMGDLQEWENLGGYDNQKLLDTVEETVTAWCLGAQLHSIDLGKVTFGDGSVRYSVNCVLMGLGVEANVYAEQVRFLGPARYDVGALGAIAMNRHRTYKVTIDGAEVDYPASIVGIYGTQSATFRMVPGAKVDDGLLDFSGLSPMPRGELLHVFDEMKRDGSHVYEAGVVHHRGKRIEIVSGDGPELVNVDGENCGCAPLVCEVQPGAVQFLAAGACMR